MPVSARRLGTWAVVRIVGRSPAELSALSATYPDLIPALFPGVDAQPAFGMFDPVELAKRGRPVVRHDHVREVRIALTKDSGRGEHEQGEGGGHDPMAFDGATSIPYVKLNRQGLLRLRIFQKQGENWNPTGGDLREFTAIEVLK